VIDYSYVECSSACMTALAAFAAAHPAHRAREVARALERGRRFVLKARPPAAPARHPCEPHGVLLDAVGEVHDVVDCAAGQLPDG